MAELFWRMKREPTQELNSIREKINGHVYESIIDPLNDLNNNFLFGWFNKRWPGTTENISASVYPFADGQSKATDLFSAVKIDAPALFLNFSVFDVGGAFDNLEQTLKSNGISVTTFKMTPISDKGLSLPEQQIIGLNQYINEIETRKLSE